MHHPRVADPALELGIVLVLEQVAQIDRTEVDGLGVELDVGEVLAVEEADRGALGSKGEGARDLGTDRGTPTPLWRLAQPIVPEASLVWPLGPKLLPELAREQPAEPLPRRAEESGGERRRAEESVGAGGASG